MNATLTLDDDVAVLLERAREERGRNLEELGNELLRRTLRQLGATPRKLEPAAPRAAQSLGASPFEARIDQLYNEIRDLVGRSAENPGLETEIERKSAELHALQAEEVTAWGQRSAARRHLPQDEGSRLLAWAARLVGA